MTHNLVTTGQPIGSSFRVSTSNQQALDLFVEPALTPGTLTNLTNVFFVDQLTSVPSADQTGNIETPFATLLQAVNLCIDPVLDYEIWVTPGDYHLEVLPVAPVGANMLTIRSLSLIFYIGNVVMPSWVTGTQSLICENLTWNTAIGGSNLKFISCELSDVTATDSVEAADTFFGAPVACSSIQATRCAVNGRVDATGGGTFNECEIGFTHDFAGGTGTHEVIYQQCHFFTAHNVMSASDEILDCTVRNCRFDLGVDFIGGAGSRLNIDPSSWQQQQVAGSVTGPVVTFAGSGLTARISVVVPAIIAAGIDYVDVSTVGTVLELLPPGWPIIANPIADLAAAGAGAGGFMNARVSATSTIRCCFAGILAGGATDFNFTTTTGW